MEYESLIIFPKVVVFNILNSVYYIERENKDADFQNREEVVL